MRHKVNISVSTLKRVLRYLNLKRKNLVETQTELVAAAILCEVQASGLCIGYRSMWQRLKTQYNFTVKRATVLKLMHLIDPEGIERRSRYILKIRLYDVPVPNYSWHVDGFDKLKEFGMAVHGGVDGFSRKVIWLKIGTTNNKPEVIAHHFLNAIK